MENTTNNLFMTKKEFDIKLKETKIENKNVKETSKKITNDIKNLFIYNNDFKKKIIDVILKNKKNKAEYKLINDLGSFIYYNEECKKIHNEILNMILDEDFKSLCDFFISSNEYKDEFFDNVMNDSDIVSFENNIKNELNQKRPDYELIESLIAEKFVSLYHPFTNQVDDNLEMFYYEDGIYLPDCKCKLKEFVEKILGKKINPNIMSKITLKVETKRYIRLNDIINEQTDELCLKNGIFNTKTRELTPHTHEKIFFIKLPIMYDKTKKIDKIDSFFDEVLSYEGDKKIIQEFLGFILTSDYKYRKALMLYGSGKNGKSVLQNLIESFVGIKNISAISLQNLAGQFDKQSILHKMVNIGGDIPPTPLNDAEMFKKFTGNDVVEIHRKFQTALQYRNRAKFIFSCNIIPTLVNDDEAFYERWIFINFERKFLFKEEMDRIMQDETVSDKIKSNLRIRDNEILDKITTEDELSGLLNWALEGLDRLKQQKDFSTSPSTLNVKERWLSESNPFYSFSKEYLENDYDSMISVSDIKTTFLDYCRLKNINLTVADKVINAFISSKLGCIKKTINTEYNSEKRIYENRIYIWQGIKYKEDKGGYYDERTPLLSKINLKTDKNIKDINKKILEQEDLFGNDYSINEFN